MSLLAATLAALLLILVLFGVAAAVEARGAAFSRRPALRRAAYTLALGVYCSSWTFYGAVGSAVRQGWTYLPIYIAPILLLLFAPRFLRRLSEAVAEEKASTVSDFIAARFGHDTGVARLVTIIALLGTIPYLALQLRSIGGALTIVSGREIMAPAMLIAAALLTLFAILFGARRFELSGRSEGLVYAIGLDSLLKILALAGVAVLAVVLLGSASEAQMATGITRLGEQFAPEHLSLEFAVILLISALAIVALPRQFYMGLVEARDSHDLERARFGLSLYIAAMALMALPIALAGLSLLPAGAEPDLFVLQLPGLGNHGFFVALALLGGIGAAASMAIVDTTALATMVSNDLLAGAVIRQQEEQPAGAIGRRMLATRRISIMGIMVLALSFAMLIAPNQSLASMGLVAFAAMAQFTPHLLLATYGGARDPLAARLSLTAGLVLWFYTLALPPILPADWLAAISAGPFDPLRLFGIGKAGTLVHGVGWSLGLNLTVLALVSARRLPAPVINGLWQVQRHVGNIGELSRFVAGFIGDERARQEFPEQSHHLAVDQRAARKAQALIAGVVGASSARKLVASALASGQMALADVTRLLDQGGQSLRFSRRLLASTLENIDSGISVVDANLDLAAWNSRYEQLFDYPPGMVEVGVSIEVLIRHNAERGDFGQGDLEQHVQKRLDHLRRGLPHSFERRRSDGRVLKTVGGPMPGGGYVMSFTDITEEARIRDELERTLTELESRVEQRTHELSDANRLLARAAQDKTRFLAAASHDLLQPLHAARLFTAALGRDAGEQSRQLISRVENAIVGAEELLRALLDITKIDAGGVTPHPERVALAPFLGDLVESFRPMTEAKGLKLRNGTLFGAVRTDPGLLRSVMQNFLSNAVRYTDHGGVLVGVRRRGDWLRIDVIDSGVGIAEGQKEAIFGEFTRLGVVEAEGFGLGLALVERIVRLIGGRVEVASNEGRGSRFSLFLPEASGVSDLPPVLKPAPTAAADVALHVLVVDNDPRIVEATIALVEALGHHAHGAATMAGALAVEVRIDAVLADYRLDHGEDGLSVIAQLRKNHPALPAAILTAEALAPLRPRAEAMGVTLFAKPVDPGAIEQFLASVSMLQVET